MRLLPIAVIAATGAIGDAGVSSIPVIQVRIPLVTAPVATDGVTIIAFEVETRHYRTVSGDPSDLAVLDADTRQLIASYSGAELAARSLASSGASQPAGRTTARQIRTFVEARLPRGAAPRALVVKVTFGDSRGQRLDAWSARTHVDTLPTPVLSPPLTGGPWVAVHSPEWSRGHRRAVITADGHQRIPGRFAVDWVRVDASGRTTLGDRDRPSDAFGYGAPVLAVANSLVVAVRDGMAESRSIAANPVQPLGRASGNYVVLRIGRRRYAIYEHLRTGSVAVRPGQRLQAGRVIGALGFTGDSTGPHLHLHVAECASPIRCEGVPFAIRGMTELGRYADVGRIGRMRWDDSVARGRLAAEWPGYNVVVGFD